MQKISKLLNLATIGLMLLGVLTPSLKVLADELDPEQYLEIADVTTETDKLEVDKEYKFVAVINQLPKETDSFNIELGAEYALTSVGSDAKNVTASGNTLTIDAKAALYNKNNVVLSFNAKPTKVGSSFKLSSEKLKTPVEKSFEIRGTQEEPSENEDNPAPIKPELNPEIVGDEKDKVKPVLDDLNSDDIKVNEFTVTTKPSDIANLSMSDPLDVSIIVGISSSKNVNLVVRQYTSFDFDFNSLTSSSAYEKTEVIDGRNYIYKDFSVVVKDGYTLQNIDSVVSFKHPAPTTKYKAKVIYRILNTETYSKIGEDISIEPEYAQKEINLYKQAYRTSSDGKITSEITNSNEAGHIETVIGYEDGKNLGYSSSNKNNLIPAVYCFSLNGVDFLSSQKGNYGIDHMVIVNNIQDKIPEGALFDKTLNPNWDFNEGTRIATYIGSEGYAYTKNSKNGYGLIDYDTDEQLTLKLYYPSLKDNTKQSNTVTMDLVPYTSKEIPQVVKGEGITYNPYDINSETKAISVTSTKDIVGTLLPHRETEGTSYNINSDIRYYPSNHSESFTDIIDSYYVLTTGYASLGTKTSIYTKDPYIATDSITYSSKVEDDRVYLSSFNLKEFYNSVYTGNLNTKGLLASISYYSKGVLVGKEKEIYDKDKIDKLKATDFSISADYKDIVIDEVRITFTIDSLSILRIDSGRAVLKAYYLVDTDKVPLLKNGTNAINHTSSIAIGKDGKLISDYSHIDIKDFLLQQHVGYMSNFGANYDKDKNIFPFAIRAGGIGIDFDGVEHTFKDIAQLFLFPSYVDYSTLNSEYKSKIASNLDSFLSSAVSKYEGLESELIENYKNTGQTALIFRLKEATISNERITGSEVSTIKNPVISMPSKEGMYYNYTSIFDDVRYFPTYKNGTFLNLSLNIENYYKEKESSNGLSKFRSYFTATPVGEYSGYYVNSGTPDVYDINNNGSTEELVSHISMNGNTDLLQKIYLNHASKGLNDDSWVYSSPISKTTVEHGAEYKMSIVNNFPSDENNLEIMNVLPRVGDTEYLTEENGKLKQRNSTMNVYLKEAVTSPLGLVYYSIKSIPNSTKEALQEFMDNSANWINTLPQDLTKVTAIKVSGINLKQSGVLDIPFKVTIDSNAKMFDKAINSYMLKRKGIYAESNKTTTKIAPPNVKEPITITKSWVDHVNGAKYRPDVIEVNLLQNNNVIKTFNLEKIRDWKTTISNLEKYNEETGEDWVYSIKESNIPNYTSSINGFDITNTFNYSEVTTSISGLKFWDDDNNSRKERPIMVVIDVYADGEKVNGVQGYATDLTNWKYTIDDLPKYKNEKEIVYTVKEQPVENYTPTVNGFNIVNTYTEKPKEKLFNIEIVKEWNDFDNKYSYRPDDITVELWRANVDDFNSTPKFSEKHTKMSTLLLAKDLNNWKEVVKDLKATDEETGLPYVYYLKEVDKLGDLEEEDGKVISGTWKYEFNSEAVSYKEGVESQTLTGTNLLIREATKDETVTKKWVDESNKLNKRPKEIKIKVYQDGKKLYLIKHSEVIEGEFYSTKKYAYWSESDFIPELWQEELEYLDEKDEQAFKDKWGIDPLEFKEVFTDLDEEFIVTGTSDIWTLVIKDLPKYDKDGKEYKYTFDEVEVEGYSKEVNGNVITNTIKPSEPEKPKPEPEKPVVPPTQPEKPVLPPTSTIDITGVKTWDDQSNKFGTRPSEIELTLFQNGEEYKTIKVTSKDDWKYTISALPKQDSNNKDYVYTIKETKVKDYQTTISGYNIHNKYINNQKVQVTGTKKWVDDNDKLGKRPESITVILLQNGEEYKRLTITDWGYSFTDLPKYDDNLDLYSYSIKELDVEGYESEVIGYNLVNTLTPEKKTPVLNPTVPKQPVKPSTPKQELPKTGSETDVYLVVIGVLLVLTSCLIKKRGYSQNR